MWRAGQRLAPPSETSWFASWHMWTWAWSRQLQSFCSSSAKKAVSDLKWRRRGWKICGLFGWVQFMRIITLTHQDLCVAVPPFSKCVVLQWTTCWSTRGTETQQDFLRLEDFLEEGEERLSTLTMRTQTQKNTNLPNLCESSTLGLQ